MKLGNEYKKFVIFKNYNITHPDGSVATSLMEILYESDHFHSKILPEVVRISNDLKNGQGYANHIEHLRDGVMSDTAMYFIGSKYISYNCKADYVVVRNEGE